MDPRDSYRVHEVAASLGLPVPIIALCLGEKGKLSRVLNSRYDNQPITTTLLPYISAFYQPSPHIMSSPTALPPLTRPPSALTAAHTMPRPPL